MLENVQGVKALRLPVSGGIDEVSPADGARPEDAIKMTNWRLSKDGKRIQKRAGLQEEETAFAQDIYGYATYHNSSDQFCEVCVQEAIVQRSTAGGAWGTILTFSTSLDHTVRPLEIQDKQFIITEKGSRVILSNGDVRQIGITAPTTLPTAVAAYAGSTTPPVNDLMNYANQAAMDAVWADNDEGNSASTLATSDPDAVPGPDADAKYMRLLQGTPASGGAKRTKTLSTTTIGLVKYSAQIATYFDVIPEATVEGLRFRIDNSVFDFTIEIAKGGVVIEPRNGILIALIAHTVPTNKWIIWNLTVDATDLRNTVVTVFMTYDGFLKAQGSATIYPKDTSGSQKIELFTEYHFFTAVDVHVDHVKVFQAAEDMAQLSGEYRYAVSFLREGNYGCESNAIKSSIGTVVFAGTGVNDMTVNSESEYTGARTKSILLKLKTAASPQDTIQWSEDAGQTWSAEIKLATKVYLGQGITVNFATITGHTANDTWTIPANACSAIATLQQITLSSIPTSSDEQVTARKIYRTTAGGSTFYYLTTIYDRATTTQFVDNFADALLGDELEEDRDLFTAASSTIGKFAEWWDNRLWIVDHVANVIYYSAIREGGPVPEEFSLDERFMPINRGDQDDTVTAFRAYKDALYVFKRNDIFIIQKTSAGYSPYHLNTDLGCVSDNCVEIVNDFLIFPSERGIELYDGVRSYSPEFSVAIDTTYRTADPAGYKYNAIAHDKEFNEVWLSIPSRLAGAAAITLVWNYIRNKFYFFQFYKTPSWIGRCKDSTGKSVLKMGTRDGYLLLCDYGTADHTTAITATYRKPWVDMVAHGIVHKIQTDFELPATKTLTLNIYVDMDKDVFRTAALTGITPSATDLALRRVIGDKQELGVRGRWFSVEYTNAEDCGGDCKINDCIVYVRPEVLKNKTYAD